MISPKILFGGAILLVAVSLRGSFSANLAVSMLDDNKKDVINEFRSLVENDLPHDYMKEANYLLRFLSAKDFQLQEAVDYLKQNLAFREEQKIDSILDEDFSDLEKRFPYDVNTVTKDGRPVLYYNFGRFAINQAAGPAEVQRFLRYSTSRMLEHADRQVRAIRKSNDDDSQFDIIINMEGYTRATHGCLSCIQLYREMLQTSESQYSGAVRNVFIINAPSVFEHVFPMISSAFLEQRSRQTINVLGGRESYEPVLVQHVAKEQLPKELQ